MESFLDRGEVISFSLVGEAVIRPEDFVQTSTTTKEEGKNCSRKTVTFLPDGTKHGTYLKKASKGLWLTKQEHNYRMGKLHGSFHSFASNGFSFRCSGVFEEGVPIGTFRICVENMWTFLKYKYTLSFERGLPVLFVANFTNRKHVISWKRNSLFLEGKKYTDISFSDQKFSSGTIRFWDEIHKMNKGTTLFCEGWTHITKTLQKVYGTDSKGKRVRILIPAFPQWNIFTDKILRQKMDNAKFLGKGEVVSFALVENIDICPERFVSKKSYKTSEHHVECFVEEEVLPNDTRHGKFHKKKKGLYFSEETTANFFMGELNGEFTMVCNSVFAATFFIFFKEGKATRMEKQTSRERHFMEFEDGLPVKYGRVGETPYSITWDLKERTLSSEPWNTEFKNVFFSKEEKAASAFCWVGVTAPEISVFPWKAYGENDKGEIVRFRVPVFL